MSSLTRAVVDHSKIVVSVFLLIAVATGLLTNFRIGNSYKDWVDTTGPPFQRYQNLVDNFGDAETLLAVFELKQINANTVASYFGLLKSLRAMDGVVSVHEPAGMLLGATAQFPPEAMDIKILRDALESQPGDYRNAIISRDARTAAMLVLVDSDRPLTHRAILNTLEHGFRDLGIPIDLAGTVYFSESLSRAIGTDMALINTLLFGAAILLLIYFFRSPILAICVALGIGLAILYSLAACLAFGLTINLLTLLLIPLVYCVGLTTSIHLFSRRRNCQWDYHDAIARIGRPASIAALTTAVGCSAFYFAPQPIVSRMGVVLPLGVLFSFITTLLFVPALLKVLSPQHKLSAIRHRAPRFSLAMRRATSGLLVAASLAGIFSLPRLTINPDAIFFFEESSPVIQSYQRIERDLSGLLISDLIIYAGDGQDMLSDEHTAQVNSLARALRRVPEITTVASGYELQLRQRFSIGATNVGKSYFSDDKNIARVTLHMRNLGGRPYSQIAEQIDEIWQTQDNSGLSYDLTGVIPLILEAQDHLLTVQSIMFPIAVAVICFILFVVFKSGNFLLLAIAANFVPITITAGAMVWLDIPINSINLFVSSVMIGVIVDDTVHLLHAYRVHGSMSKALDEVGTALWITSLIVCVAFASLAVSHLIPIQQFGILSVIAVSSAWLCDVCLLPTLATKEDPV